MKKISTLIILGCFAFVATAQSLKPIAQKINTKKEQRQSFVQAQLFDVTSASLLRNSQLSNVVSYATVMEFRQGDALNILASGPENLNFVIPSGNGTPVELELYRVNFFTPDFSVTTSGSNGQPVAYTGGIHYWGIIKGDNTSLAAISVFNNEVMGMISTSNGNFVLGKLENDATGKHIFYNDRNLNAVSNLECFTEEDNISYEQKDLQNPNRVMANCIRLFWEVNFDIYTGKGSVANAANYVTGLFNQSAIIYTNDAIPVELSEVFVWNTTSPYTSTSTSGLLGQFQTYRNSINGDLGHLLGYSGGGGVAAGFSGICASNLNSSQCYSGVNSSYSNVPTYSWSVMVVTHEQGHLMGSRHTHACVWNGNNTAIDNCGPTAGYGYEGSCSGAPTPVGGGTIMSYCHLVGGVGINLANGFGTQPKNVILNNFNNGACLTACIGTACMPSANMSTASVLSTTATFNWAAATGALSYNIRYRVVGSGTWLTGTSATTSYNATGLTPGANYEWQVQTVCQTGGTSIFTISTTFTTTPTSCLPPTNLSTTNISYSSATFNWSAASGATSYNVQYRIVGAGSWTAGTTATTSFNAFSLVQTSNYEWQVQTVCAGGGTSSFTSSTLFTTTTQPCITPQNNYTTNISSNSAVLYSSGATGGTVNLQYRVVGAPSWISLPAVAVPYTLTGLSPSTNYEWQAQAICGLTFSGWSNSVLFTTLCAAPNATITANGNTTFCAGGSVLLTANSGTFTYQWLLNGVNISGQTSMNYSANATGNYSVIVSATGGCADTSAITVVTVNPLPGATIVPQGSTTFCTGGSVNLLANTGTGLTYIWKNNGTTISGATASNYTATVSGNYTVVVTNSSGCSSTSSAVAVSVGSITAAVTPGGTVNVCAGSNTTLTASSGTGYSYQWYRNGVAQANGTASTFTTSSSGTYYCIITSGACTATSNTVTVNSINNPAAVISYTSPLSFCSPGSVLLTANTFSGVTYQWQKNAVDIAGATVQTYSANANGSYRVRETANGCSKYTSAVSVTTATSVSAAIAANGPTNFCQGGSVVLNVTAAVPGYSYQWKNNTVNISGATASSYTVAASGSYTCQVSASCGSAVSNAIVVSTGSITATISPSGTVTMCNGASVTMTANSGTGYTYQWKLNGTNITGATSSTYTASSSGNYTVEINSPCGSNTSTATTVNISAVTASITPAGASTVCAGSNIIYSANTGFNYTYQWKRNGVNIGGATNATYAASSNGTYSVVITQGGACSATSANGTLTVINNPAATITANGPTAFCAGQSVTLTANTFAGVVYQWQKNGSNISGATSQSYTATATGGYRVKETANGCSKYTSAISVTVNCRIANTDAGNELRMAGESDFKIVPNPFTESTMLVISPDVDLENGSVLMIDILGKEVKRISNPEGYNLKIEKGNLPSGIYSVQVLNGNERIYTARVVIQ